MKPQGFRYHETRWPHSLAVAYMERTPLPADWPVLEELVEARQRGAVAPPKDSLVVHLRAGDVLDRSAISLQDHLRQVQPLCWSWDALESDPAYLIPRTTGFVYVQPLSYYENIQN